MSRDVIVQSGDRWLFRCPGCGCAHQVDGRWTFNGDTVRPTIRASILIHGAPSHPRCHSYVTNGRIDFLNDSTHPLAGKTVDLPPWETAG